MNVDIRSMADLRTYLNEFLEHLEIEKNRSRATIQNYRFYLERFINWARERRATQPGHITSELIRQYRLWLNRLTDSKGEALKKNTQNYHLIAIRSWLKYLAKRDVVALAAEKIELMKIAERQVEFLDGDDLKRLLEAPTKIAEPKIIQKRDQAILATLFSTGLRVSELANLKIENINLEKPPKDGLTEFTVRGKGRKLRVVFLSSDARELLKSYTALRRDVSPYLFIRHDRAHEKYETEREKKEGGAPLTPRSIERTVKKYAKVAGITKKVSPHTLRHCLHATTRIATPGSMVSAENLWGTHGAQVVSMDYKTNKFRLGKIARHYRHYNNNFLNIWASGRELTCTEHHALFAVTENGISRIEAKDVTINSYLAGVRHIPYRGRPTYHPDFWRLVGYIVGDGTLSETIHGILISDKNYAHIRYYQLLAERVVGHLPIIRKASTSKSWTLCIYNVRFLRQLRQLGITQKSPLRRIPPQLNSSSTPDILAFLAGYYDAEGNAGNIRFFSTSKDLLKDVQTLLLRFSIDSYLQKRLRMVRLPQGKMITHMIYSLHVLQEESEQQFRTIMPTLKHITMTKRATSRRRNELLPAQALFRAIHSDAKIKAPGLLYKLEAISMKHFNRYKRICITRPLLRKFIVICKKNKYTHPALQHMWKLANATNIRWLKVLNVRKLRITGQVAYDYTVTPYHNFVTDGFLSHNSYATDLLQGGADIRSVQALLGHASITTTQVYTHITDPHLREVHRAFHNRKKALLPPR